MERAPHDLKSVITTYEGKHNHSVPAARSGNSVPPANGPAQGASAAAGSVSAHLHRPEPSQPQNGMVRFDRPSRLSSLGQLGLGPHNGFNFGMNQPGLPNLAIPGLDPGQGKSPVMPCLVSEMGFMLPKEEPKVEPHLESPLNLPQGESSIYHQIMRRLPLGPQM